MLTVTDAARAHLAELLEERGASGEEAVRFVASGNGVSLEQDGQRDGDACFEHEGRTVLLLDPKVSELLAEDTLDCADDKLKLECPKHG